MIQGVPYDAEIEYLESTGTQYIDTGIKMSSQLTITAKLGYASDGQFYFGAYDNSKSPTVRLSVSRSGSHTFYFLFSDSTDPGQTPQLSGGLHNVTISKDGWQYDGVATSWSRTDFARDTNIFIFGRSVNGDIANQSSARVASFQILSDGVLIRDFIPVRVGTVGYLYDRVSGKLFGNMGTGSFVLGQDIAIPVKSIRKYDNFYTPMPGKIIRGGAMARDYIQNGLVAMWDGIENAGFGRHDPNATVWVDLAGGRDINLLSSLWGDAYADMSGTYGLAASTIPAESVITMESVAMFADSRGLSGTFRANYILPSPAATNSGVTRTVRGLCWDRNAATDVTRSNGWMIRSRGSTYDTSTYGNVARIVAIYDGIDTMNIRATKMYVNSVAASLTNNGASHNPEGVRVGTQDAFFTGRLYACRIYSRALTATEIAHNHAIDVERFGVPS